MISALTLHQQLQAREEACWRNRVRQWWGHLVWHKLPSSISSFHSKLLVAPPEFLLWVNNQIGIGGEGDHETTFVCLFLRLSVYPVCPGWKWWRSREESTNSSSLLTSLEPLQLEHLSSFAISIVKNICPSLPHLANSHCSCERTSQASFPTQLVPPTMLCWTLPAKCTCLLLVILSLCCSRPPDLCLGAGILPLIFVCLAEHRCLKIASAQEMLNKYPQSQMKKQVKIIVSDPLACIKNLWLWEVYPPSVYIDSSVLVMRLGHGFLYTHPSGRPSQSQIASKSSYYEPPPSFGDSSLHWVFLRSLRG